MPDNIENTVGLQFCLWKENNKVNSVPKGNTYPLYLNKRNEFFVDESCVGKKSKNPKHTVEQARWAFIYDFFYKNLEKAKQEDITENLWGPLSGGKEKIAKYGLGLKYKQGSSIVFNPQSYSYYFGFKQRVELFSENPGTGFYFYIVPVDKPKISYAYFTKSEEVKRYGESVTLQIMLHAYNLDEKNKYKAKLYLLEETSAKGLTKTGDFEDNNLWKEPKVYNISNNVRADDDWNSYINTTFPIEIEWKKNENVKKNFTVVLEIYRCWEEPGMIYGKNSKEERVNYKNYADDPTSDLIEYDPKVLGLKDIDDKNSISSRFIVSEELMDHYLTRVEQEKNNMIQYIGDIRYTQKGIDPCGYSTITIKDESDKDKDPLVIFDEDDIKSPIDRTSQIFGLIAGEERKNVSITLGNLTNKKVLCNGLLLEAGQKHDDVKRVFQIDRVMPALRNKDGVYIVVQDPEQAGDVDVVPDKKRGLSKDVSEVQQWQEGIDFKFEGEDKMILMLRYMYNKTAFEKSRNPDNKAVNNVMNDLWLFNYFLLTQDKAQIYFLPVSTCRYPNQLAKINVYPDIEWLLSLKLSSTTPNVYSHTNMPSGVTHEIHQERALEAGNNRRWLNKEVSFELVLKATTGSVEKSIGVSYEEKITTLLKALIKVKETLDSICGVTSARSGMAAGIADRLPGFLGKSPITFQLDYPVITIEGGWKFGYNAATKNVEPQGKLAVAFTPLIKGTGKLDLIACAEFIPPAKPIIVAIRTATKAVGVDIWFNLYAFGQIDISYTFLFGAVDGVEPLNIATTVGVGAELGVKASAEVPKLSFGGDTTDDMDIGFEASARGETSIIISGKQGSTTEGIYVEPSLGFGGMVVFVTAKASVWKMGVGFEEKPYELIKPEPDLLKDRFYIIKANNDKK